MISGKKVFLLFILCLVLSIINNPLVAHEYNLTEDWSLEYNPCEGKISIRFLYYVDDSDDDFMDWFYIDFQEENGNYTPILRWEDFNFGGNNGNFSRFSKTFYYYHYGFNNSIIDNGNVGNKYYCTLHFYNIRPELLGQNVNIKIRGKWNEGGGTDQDFSNQNITKNIRTEHTPNLTNIQATRGNCNNIRLSWDEPNPRPCSDKNKFTVFVDRRLWNTTNTWTNIGNTKENFYNDITAADGTSYEYRMHLLFEPNAYIDDWASSHVGFLEGYSRAAPGVPTNLTVSVDRCDSTILIQWTNTGQTDTTSIYRSNTWLNKVTNTNFFVDKVSTLDFNYNYRIRGKNTCLDSSGLTSSPGVSGKALSKPKKPTNLSVQANEITKRIQIQWKDNSSNETEFQIKRNLKNAGNNSTEKKFSFPANPGVGAILSFIDSSVVECEEYVYSISPVGTCNALGLDSIATINAVLPPNLSNVFEVNSEDASKGYFVDKVELNWVLKPSFVQSLNNLKIYRKLLSAHDSTYRLLSTIASNSGFYSDNTTEAGTLYKYKVQGELFCGVQNTLFTSNYIEMVGFRLRTGVITGKVNYSGGSVVAGVNVSASTIDNLGNSISFSGTTLEISNNSDLNLTDQFLFECWVKPNSYSSNFTIVEKDSSYYLKFLSASNEYEFGLYGTTVGLKTKKISSSLLPLNNYNHIAIMYRDGKMLFFINGVEKANFISSFTIQNNSKKIIIGNSFNGHLDEIRLWNVKKSNDQMNRDFNRFVVNNESGLLIYLKLDEASGNFAYDISKQGTLFGKHHASITGTNYTWSTSIPSSSQLNYTSYTDSLGNYILVVPYSGSGSIFNIVPSYLVHTFTPSSTSLFIGDGGLIHNNVNFLDNSSFRVQGSVIFSNSTCSVPDVQIFLDGVQLISNGAPELTDPLGQFDIQVPVGNHFITVHKAGHIFAVGRFPETGEYNFQAPLAGILFKDTTLYKVIGRVVGGTRESNKKPGFGKSRNNIGKANLTFTSQQGNGCMTKVVSTDSISGEYSVLLPPLKYIPQITIPSNLGINFGTLSLVDLTTISSSQSLHDTFHIDNAVIDSFIEFHKQLDYVYRVLPVIKVLDDDGVSPFIGDESYEFYNNETEETTTVNLRTNPFQWPVFTPRTVDPNDLDEYLCKIRIYEPYTRYDVTPYKHDSVPNLDGILKINNELADYKNWEYDLSQIEDIGTIQDITYTFGTGVPNFLENLSIPEYSYTRKFQIDLQLSSNQIISWNPVPSNPNIPGGGDLKFRGYVLGKKSDQTQFVTFGPQVVDYILRDPPGSASSASREIGTTKSSIEKWKWNLGTDVGVSDGLFSGTKQIIGIGVAVETNFEVNQSAGFKVGLSGGQDGSIQSTIENTTEWSTYSGTVIAPGANSDLYIGTSRNMEFGLSQELTIFPDDLCNKIECLGDNPGSGFSIGKKYGLSMVPNGYETHFMFNEYDIKNLIIPQLTTLRNQVLQSNSKYSSYLSTGDDNYGKNNDDPDFGNDVTTDSPYNYDFEDLDGPSYKFEAMTYQDTLELDSVRLINDQIRLWEDALYLNEWDKINSTNTDSINEREDYELSVLDSINADIITEYNAVQAAGGFSGVAAFALAIAPAPGTAYVGYAVFGVTTALNIAASILLEKYNIYQEKRQRIKDKYDEMGNVTNYTLTGGTKIKSSMTHSTATSFNRNIEFQISSSMDLEFKAKINNNGIGFEKSFALSYSGGRDWSKEESEKETVAFELNDPDIGDLYSVDVYPSLLGFGPIFRNKAGGHTSCPHEPEVISSYYNPGDTLSHRTLQIDKPKISAAPTILTNIPADQAAVYNLTLSNESENGYIMEYGLDVVSASNPFGAIVRIDGLAGQRIIIPPGSSINKTLTISKGPGPTYNYDNILVVFHSICQYTGGAGFNTDIVDSVYLSAHFTPSCTNIELVSPEPKWVVNNSYNNILPVAIANYNYNYFDLENFNLDYKPGNSGQWINLEKFYKDTAGLNLPNARLISNNTPVTLYDWDVSQLTDGQYDLRVVSECSQANKSSLIYSGIIDRINPHPFGHPSPADGILTPNDEISIQFNEPIDIGSINPATHIDIRGVLNGGNTDHLSYLNFDGNDYASNPSGVVLQKRDFTFEFVAKRNAYGEQAIFSQGSSVNDRIFIGFNINNKFVFRINNQEVSSLNPYADGQWRYYAVSYDYESETAQLYVADGNNSPTLVNPTNTSIQADFTNSGAFYFGKNSFDNPWYLKANLHNVRIWNYAKSLAQYSATRAKELSNSEVGLLHYWKMNEAEGQNIIDYVRRRDATINGATWQVDPTGKSCRFISDDYLNITSSDVAINNEMDATIEFWFRSQQTSAATLFSNGTGTGTQSDSSVSWNIDKDNNGNFIIRHSGLNWQATDINYFDNDWHHFALVLRRGVSLTSYVDGVQQKLISDDSIKQLSGSSMSLGARVYKIGNITDSSNFFTGNIDEFRVWNIARSFEQIQRDKRFRLLGNESGLVVYIPFETYTVDNTGIPILTESFTDIANPLHVISLINNPSFSSLTPTLKLPRPIQKIAFNYSVNNDKMIITPTSLPSLIENVTLDVTVNGIKDLRGNVLQSPASWIAYVDKNQIVWQDDRFDFNLMKNQELKFSTKILNKGGATQQFSIVDIPAWLTISQTSGSIAPNSAIEIHFKVDPLVNLGSYEIYLGLIADFKYAEMLNINLSVNATPPQWNINPSQFEYNANFIGLIKIDDVISVDPNDKLAAFMGNELRGVANLEYVSSIDAFRVFLTVYNTTTIDEIINFKIWDASTGKIYSEVLPLELSFGVNTVQGSLLDPLIFETSNKVNFEIPVRQGWNWLGFFLETPDIHDLNNVLSSVSIANNHIKNRDAFANCNSNLNWTGSLTGSNGYGIQPTSMYKLNSVSSDTLVIKGVVIDPSTREIKLDIGWTWIGFISLRNLAIEEALGNLTPGDGDIIKSKTAFAVYYDGIGWTGSLKTLISGEGYMYYSKTENNFTYPQSGMFENLNILQTRDGEEIETKTDHENYPSNMTIIAAIDNDCDVFKTDDRWMLVLMDEQQNVRAKQKIDLSLENSEVFLTAAGDVSTLLHYKLMRKGDNNLFSLDNAIQFRANQHLGSIDNPYFIKISKELCQEMRQDDKTDLNDMNLIPNITKSKFTANIHSYKEFPNSILQCTDILGKVCFKFPIHILKGMNQIPIQAEHYNLVSGSYILEWITDDHKRISKFIITK